MSKYRIEVKEGSAHGDLYELEQQTYHYLIDNKTGKTLLDFVGEYFAS